MCGKDGCPNYGICLKDPRVGFYECHCEGGDNDAKELPDLLVARGRANPVANFRISGKLHIVSKLHTVYLCLKTFIQDESRLMLTWPYTTRLIINLFHYKL